jgi:lycopene cyclase domain-containing protein
MGFTYLGLLLFSIGGMLLLDWRHRLFFWRDARAAAIVTAIAAAGLLAADAAGIAAGLFLRGDGAIATGIVIAPHMPIEEPVFLVFLVLLTAVLYTGSVRILAQRERTAR